MRKLKPLHPGEILREEFMQPLGLTAYRLAKEIHVSVPRVNDIVRERRGISAEMALRLSAYLGTTAEFWANLQSDYEQRLARARLGSALKQIKPYPRDKTGSPRPRQD